MALESFEEWKRNKVQNVETTPSSGLLPLQGTGQSNSPESFQSWAQKKGIEIKPQGTNTYKPDLQKIQNDIFNEMNTPAPFAKGIVDKISSMPANLFSPIVAEAPSSEDRLMGINRTEQYMQDHPLSRLDNIITSNIAKGYTGGILHPESVKPETFGEKAASAFASGIGTISSIQVIEKNLATELQTPTKIKSFISKYPKVAEYAIPVIDNALKNIPGFAVYGQLDPELKSTTDRLKRLVEDSAMAGTQSLLSPLPKITSVPLNGILFSGLAKLSGASNEDATAQGVVGMLFDSLSPRFKVSKELTVGKVNSILGEKAAETINKFSKTKITPESSDIEIKQAYIEAIKSSHPDLGGKLEDAASINAARDILLKDNRLPINENNVHKDEVIIPKDGQMTPKVAENPVVIPTVQEAKLTAGNNLIDQKENLDQYKQNNLIEQSKKAVDLINNDLQKAISIIDGKEPVPPDIQNEVLLKNMSEYVLKNPNRDLQFKILNSPLAQSTSAQLIKDETNKGTSKIAERIKNNAIEQGFTKEFSNLAEYDKVTRDEQSKKVADLMNNDFDKSVEILEGKRSLPEGLRGISLIIGFKEYLKNNPNEELYFKLASSPLVSGTSYAAQELALSGALNPESSISKIQQIKKNREKRFGVDKLKKIRNDIKSINKETRKVNLSKDELKWDNFLDSITC